MAKLTFTAKKFCGFAYGSEAQKAFDAATIETNPEYFFDVLVYVDGDNVYTKRPVQSVSNRHSMCKNSGGKWEQVNPYNIKREGGVTTWLNNRGAIESDYKGQPRIKK